MTESDPRTQLDEQLRALESACRAFDEGDATAADQIAAALVALFQPTGTAPSLLGRAGGTYARLASSIPKPPHPQDFFLPLVNVSQSLGSAGGYVVQASTGPAGLTEPPRCRPPLGRVSTFRQVQAPDWWKTEPAALLDHSKLTRRDLALSALADEAQPTRDGRPLKLQATLAYGATLEVPWPAARGAALRQVGHEVLGSLELLTLAGRKTR